MKCRKERDVSHSLPPRQNIPINCPVSHRVVDGRVDLAVTAALVVDKLHAGVDIFKAVDKRPDKVLLWADLHRALRGAIQVHNLAVMALQWAAEIKATEEGRGVEWGQWGWLAIRQPFFLSPQNQPQALLSERERLKRGAANGLVLYTEVTRGKGVRKWGAIPPHQ